MLLTELKHGLQLFLTYKLIATKLQIIVVFHNTCFCDARKENKAVIQTSLCSRVCALPPKGPGREENSMLLSIFPAWQFPLLLS